MYQQSEEYVSYQLRLDEHLKQARRAEEVEEDQLLASYGKFLEL